MNNNNYSNNNVVSDDASIVKEKYSNQPDSPPTIRIKLFSSECPAAVSLGPKWINEENLKRIFVMEQDQDNEDPAVIKERFKNIFVQLRDITNKHYKPDENGKFGELDPHMRYQVLLLKNVEGIEVKPADPHDFVESDSEDEVDEQKELEMMKKVTKLDYNRLIFIQEEYIPCHEWLYDLGPKHFTPEFWTLINEYNKNQDDKALSDIVQQISPTKVFRCQIFSMDFCRALIDEIQNFEKSGLPINRPNSMNNYGGVLDDIGFYKTFEELFLIYLRPILLLYFPNIADKIDHHHAFIVQYKLTEDLDLGFHYDDSELTLNLCLGKEFTGGELYFRGLLEDPSSHDEKFIYNHVPGVSLFHIGKHRHGAMPITAGERYNLIIWLKVPRSVRCN
jgi:hypothetical protein